jgi:hypothetical protein
MIYRLQASGTIYFSIAADSEELAVTKARGVMETFGAGLSIPGDTDGDDLDLRAYFENDAGEPPDVVDEWDDEPNPARKKGGST